MRAGFSCPVWFDMNNDGLLDLLLPGLNDWNYAWLDGKSFGTICPKIVVIVWGMTDNNGLQIKGYFVKM